MIAKTPTVSRTDIGFVGSLIIIINLDPVSVDPRNASPATCQGLSLAVCKRLFVSLHDHLSDFTGRVVIERLVDLERHAALNGLVENGPYFSQGPGVCDQNQMLKGSRRRLLVQMMRQLLGKRRFIRLAWRRFGRPVPGRSIVHQMLWGQLALGFKCQRGARAMRPVKMCLRASRHNHEGVIVNHWGTP